MKRLPALEPGEHAAQALHLVAEFLWLRPTELGRYMHPNDKHARKYAEKYLRKLLTLRYVVARKLPGRDAGTAFVLSQRGATWLNENGRVPAACPGTRWGEIHEGRWCPPSSWKHDLWAVGVLFIMRELKGFDVWIEPRLRSLEPEAQKHPDGLLLSDKGCIWLEVENARKTGKNRLQMLRAVVGAARGQAVTNYPNTPGISAAMIAVPEDSKDLHGRTIHHAQNIQRKIEEIGVKEKTTIFFVTMHLRGGGVEKLTVKPAVFWPKGSAENSVNA